MNDEKLDPKILSETAARLVNKGDGKKPDFKYLWETCVIDPNRVGEVERECARIIKNRDTYNKIARILFCAWWVPGLIHYRESSRLTLDVYLHNGQRLGTPTTIVPKGVYFRAGQFVEAAVDALEDQKLDGVTDPATFLEKAERFNGLGYRKKIGDRGVIEYSPYIWAGANHHDETGKYVRDGKFDKRAVEKQLGVAALLKGLIG